MGGDVRAVRIDDKVSDVGEKMKLRDICAARAVLD